MGLRRGGAGCETRDARAVEGGFFSPWGRSVTKRTIIIDWNDLRVRAEVSPGERGGWHVEPCGPSIESIDVSADKGATWTSPEDAGIGQIEEGKIEAQVLAQLDEAERPRPPPALPLHPRDDADLSLLYGAPVALLVSVERCHDVWVPAPRDGERDDVLVVLARVGLDADEGAAGDA